VFGQKNLENKFLEVKHSCPDFLKTRGHCNLTRAKQTTCCMFLIF
jgi:hypothetical protein